MAKKGRKYLEAAQLVDSTKSYSIEEAVSLMKKASYAKFDESIELSLRLNVDPRHADQQIRGAIVLPNGSGRSQKVCVIAQGPQEQEAKDAGADFVGGKELLEDIKKGWMDFDVIVATPNMMGELGKLGKILGPKGLMPNPKTGTVTMDVKKAVEDIKKGKVEYRVDKDGNINVLIGKVSFDEPKIVENFNTLFDIVAKARPAAVKGQYFLNVSISSTMGPGIKVAV
ncbi:large subunit ribosomal protein L1 [Breznakia sp. PF5-3]|uniref:50S ribosomal protein L1 n=1 Tax=unclassified Breznakia TaxID=2623764 RepID=UPI002404C177|nr:MULTISPECIES: 50S ribosomal protein L1 [unclassified Breznakia]MDL2276544.1 50S ribosomal protein L1 [Breznakia sp. OttesenSCG-928-G09]MDF9825551.1 large subunit ribosomal protein L1 [Breznakia sp. PM6-1]MDF9836405.1 large subunit ribosomal protein L1 [Breznakia sp. PF5-3]MDF9838204.1 large subunit ribosomal protein L1 [Breznakia sp. PFB2-8]MDF9860203.1 large subunit ribosomal protein L1 [Breznakia sp. PH5-24]